MPEALAEKDTAARGDQAAKSAQGGSRVLRWLGVAERVAGAEAENEVGGAMGGVDGGLLDEADALGQPAGLSVGAPAGEVVLIEIDAEAGRTGRRFEEAEHELAPAAADVEHGDRGGLGAEPADHPGGPVLGERAVEGEPGQPRRGGGVIHEPER